MLEHDRAVTRQMLAEPDGAPLGPAEQSGEPPPALKSAAGRVGRRRHVVEGVQHRLLAPAPQRMEVRRDAQRACEPRWPRAGMRAVAARLGRHRFQRRIVHRQQSVTGFSWWTRSG
jgi:hypothetical protein